MSIDVVEVVIWRESSVSGGSGAVQMFLRWQHLRKCSSKIITSILSFISGRLATKSNQIKQLIRNGRSASLQRTFKKSFTSFSHSTRNKTRDGLIRVRNIRALNGRFNTSITHAYSIVIGSSLGTVRHPRRFKIVVIDIQITLKQMLRDFIGIRVNRAKKSGMVNITSSVNSRERSGI